MRAPLRIASEQLRACVRDQYGLTVDMVEYLARGQDSSAGVYRMVSDQGDSYLLKARSTPLYEPSCLIPYHLKDQGIAAVVAPLPTRQGALWTQMEQWSLCLYPYIEGDSGWDPPMTAPQWSAVGAALCRIHQVPPPASEREALRVETFDPREYRRRIDAFAAQGVSDSGGSLEERELRAAWEARREMIHTAISSLETLAGGLKVQAGSYVICHADIHPSNIIRDDQGRVFVVDWDDVMLAPKEHDFLFVEDPPGMAASADGSPFFEGYGTVGIDWRALAYFRWERVVQDLLEYANIACAGDRLGRAARVEAVQRFGIATLPNARMITAARGAQAHLAG